MDDKPLSKLPKPTRVLIERAVSALRGGDEASLISLAEELRAVGMLDYTKATSGPAGGCLLHTAIAQRKPSLAARLVELGADIEVRDYRKATPLMRAAVLDLELTRLLLDRGADVLARDTYGGTALHHAAAGTGDLNGTGTAVVALLLDRGAEIDAQESAGRTPLHEAVGHLSVEKAALLLARGARVDIVGRGEIGTPLTYLMSATPVWNSQPGDRAACEVLLKRFGA